MASLQQIEANRLNATKSTGPRSDAGKAAIRFNALKSGIDAAAEVIPGEDPNRLTALLAEYQARWTPRTPETRALVDICVRNEWLLARMSRAEAALYGYSEEGLCSRTDYPLGRETLNRGQNLDRLQRRLNALQRNLQSAMKDLGRLKAAESEEEAAAPAEAAAPPRIQPQPAQSPRPEIGFDPQRSESGPAPVPPEAEIVRDEGNRDRE